MWWPLLHPLHAAADGEHVFLWAAVGVGVGLAVVIGQRIWRDLRRPEDPPER